MIAAAILVAVFVLLALVRLRHSLQQDDLFEKIEAVGGFITHEPPASLQERIAAYRQGVGVEADYTAVRLYTADITGDWLRAVDELSQLRITDLTLAETALDDTDLSRLIATHPLEVVQLRAERVGEETVAALAGSRNLRLLEIRESPLNDVQFARLPLEQLEELRIDGTAVTTSGLEELRRAGQLVLLVIDGRQINERTVQLLGRLPAFRQIELVGQDVTDEQLALLPAIPALEWVVLHRTAVTTKGTELLQSALPKCDVQRR